VKKTRQNKNPAQPTSRALITIGFISTVRLAVVDAFR